MPHVYLSAAHKSSGKTTLGIGLCRALADRGLRVQPFKKGPDYIDPMWLARAARRPCYNLDFNLADAAGLRQLFARHADAADLAIVEGNKGLHDGLALDGSNSNAALARTLGAPVVLVVDTRGITRGVAPLLLGYQAFDPEVRIGGVILNQVGGSRHGSKLRQAVEHYTDITVLGSVQADPEMAITERHLGLVPSNEADAADAQVARVARLVGEQVDLDAVLTLAATAVRPPMAPAPAGVPAGGAPVRIGIARDPAFGFYYADDLEAFAREGAELVAFDTLRDPCLPQVDGLFLGGGFPETHARELAANETLRADIRARLAAGLPAYAECGGLMYLSRSIRWGDEALPMVGVVPADAVMHARPQGRGYVQLRETGAHPWRSGGFPGPGEVTPAHEFHYSSLENVDAGLTYAYEVVRGSGVDGRQDGVVIGNLLASYAHLRGHAGNPWPRRFVAQVRRVRAAA